MKSNNLPTLQHQLAEFQIFGCSSSHLLAQPPYIPWLTALMCLNSNIPLGHKRSLQYEEIASESYPYTLRCFWPQPKNLVPD